MRAAGRVARAERAADEEVEGAADEDDAEAEERPPTAPRAAPARRAPRPRCRRSRSRSSRRRGRARARPSPRREEPEDGPRPDEEDAVEGAVEEHRHAASTVIIRTTRAGTLTSKRPARALRPARRRARPRARRRRRARRARRDRRSVGFITKTTRGAPERVLVHGRRARRRDRSATWAAPSSSMRRATSASARARSSSGSISKPRHVDRRARAAASRRRAPGTRGPMVTTAPASRAACRLSTRCGLSPPAARADDPLRARRRVLDRLAAGVREGDAARVERPLEGAQVRLGGDDRRRAEAEVALEHALAPARAERR